MPSQELADAHPAMIFRGESGQGASSLEPALGRLFDVEREPPQGFDDLIPVGPERIAHHHKLLGGDYQQLLAQVLDLRTIVGEQRQGEVQFLARAMLRTGEGPVELWPNETAVPRQAAEDLGDLRRLCSAQRIDDSLGESLLVALEIRARLLLIDQPAQD